MLTTAASVRAAVRWKLLRLPRAGRELPLIGVSDGLVGNGDDAVLDGLGVHLAQRLLGADLAEEALAGAEHNREDLQPQLVDQVMLHQRADELEAGWNDDAPRDPLLQLRDHLRRVAPQDRRVVPAGILQCRGHDVLGQVIEPVRQLSAPGWPSRREPVVATPAKQPGFSAQRFVERQLAELRLVLDRANPAAKPEAF